VTSVAVTTASAPASRSAPPSGDALNAQGYALMQRGDYQAALPVLQQAVAALAGQSSDLNDGYANYNLGVTLIHLGRCQEAMRPLEAAKQLEPDRHEVDDALRQARHCGG
jgi:tetratricopeptide (TPR) repeat protein